MIRKDYCVLMSKYNQWMNTRLYDLCATMSEEELHGERGLFFDSIYLTLNHIMYGDLAFMARFTRTPEPEAAIGDELFSGFEELRRERLLYDENLISWASKLNDEWLADSLTYLSKVDGKERTYPHWVLLTHLFNHQTHHRGQITTGLKQLGYDIGSTDLPFMPASDIAI